MFSFYCKPNGCVNDCLDYLDRALRVADGKRVLIGMDANATSDVWFSKNIHRARRNGRRGARIAEWINDKGLSVLNQPTAAYTFCGQRGRSDIDVTLFRGCGCRFYWEVSDHNPIRISMYDEPIGNSVRATGRYADGMRMSVTGRPTGAASSLSPCASETIVTWR